MCFGDIYEHKEGDHFVLPEAPVTKLFLIMNDAMPVIHLDQKAIY